MMYYTVAGGTTSYTCNGNELKDLFETLPADADVPLPPNPDLEDIAKGVVHQGKYDSRNPNDYRTNYRQGLSRYESRFGGGGMGRRPFNYDYADNRDDNQDQDYFYYDVQNQRSKSRRPNYHRPSLQDGYDDSGTGYKDQDGTGAFFGFNNNNNEDNNIGNSDSANYWDWPNQRQNLDRERQRAYTLFQEQQKQGQNVHAQTMPNEESGRAGRPKSNPPPPQLVHSRIQPKKGGGLGGRTNQMAPPATVQSVVTAKPQVSQGAGPTASKNPQPHNKEPSPPHSDSSNNGLRK